MQAAHVRDDLLQRDFDGDLDAAERSQLEAHLASCHVCAARRAAFARLSKLVSDAAMAGASGLDADALFSRIQRGIAAPESKAPVVDEPLATVVPIRSRLRTFSAVGAGLAVAAAALLMVYKPGGGERPGETAEGIEPSSATSAPAPSAEPAARSAGHSEVVQVDFGSNTGTVFDIALSDGSSTPVVWINDDE